MNQIEKGNRKACSSRGLCECTGRAPGIIYPRIIQMVIYQRIIYPRIRKIDIVPRITRMDTNKNICSMEFLIWYFGVCDL